MDVAFLYGRMSFAFVAVDRAFVLHVKIQEVYHTDAP